MANGPFGIPRPFVSDEFVITVVLNRRVQNRNRAERAVITGVGASGLEPDNANSIHDEQNTVVDIGVEEERVTMSELEEMRESIRSRLAASDIPAKVEEVVIG